MRRRYVDDDETVQIDANTRLGYKTQADMFRAKLAHSEKIQKSLASKVANCEARLQSHTLRAHQDRNSLLKQLNEKVRSTIWCKSARAGPCVDDGLPPVDI